MEIARWLIRCRPQCHSMRAQEFSGRRQRTGWESWTTYSWLLFRKVKVLCPRNISSFSSHRLCSATAAFRGREPENSRTSGRKRGQEYARRPGSREARRSAARGGVRRSPWARATRRCANGRNNRRPLPGESGGHWAPIPQVQNSTGGNMWPDGDSRLFPVPRTMVHDLHGAARRYP